jgi:PAS domain S-box-containing protein
VELSYFSRLLKTGLSNTNDPLEFNRVYLVNTLTLVSICILLSVATINLFLGNYFHASLEIVLIFLFLFIIWLNGSGRYELASTFFVNMCSVGIIVGAIGAYKVGRFTETENIYYAFLAVSIFLFDKWKMYIQCILILVQLVAIKWYRYTIQFESIDSDFFLVLINVFIVSLGLFFFLGVFKGAFLRTVNASNLQERRLYSMIDNIPLFIGLMDTKGKYKVLNKQFEKAFGKSRDEMIQADPYTFMMKDIADRQSELYKRALNGERPEFLEKTVQEDGSTYFARGKFIPIRDEKGKIYEVAIYVSNVTALQKAKEALELANKNKSKLFSMVAHDIRSPLSLFEGLVSASKNKIISQEEFLIFQEKVIERFTPLQETINDLLNWSRIQMEDVGAYPSKFSAKKAITDIVSIYKELAEQKKIKLTIDGEDATIFMDPNHFKMVIRNLLHNALKFSPVNGSVSVSYFKEEEFHVFEVKDSGVGMSPEMLAQVRNRELVRSQPGTMGESGTGLGLNLILDLLEKNNCRFDLQAEDGKGTTITFYVPDAQVQG